MRKIGACNASTSVTSSRGGTTLVKKEVVAARLETGYGAGVPNYQGKAEVF